MLGDRGWEVPKPPGEPLNLIIISKALMDNHTVGVLLTLRELGLFWHDESCGRALK